jgi:hypothetical protein
MHLKRVIKKLLVPDRMTHPVLFKVLRFLSFFSHKNVFFGKNILKSCGGGVEKRW